MYFNSGLRGLGETPAQELPVATIGGKHVVQNGKHYIIADDTGQSWQLLFLARDLVHQSTPDAAFTEQNAPRAKVRGIMTAPNTIGYVDAWSNVAAGEQTFTTIVGGQSYAAAPGVTDTREANVAATAGGAAPLFVGDNTRALNEQAAKWTDQQAQLFKTLRAPSAEALDDYLKRTTQPDPAPTAPVLMATDGAGGGGDYHAPIQYTQGPIIRDTFASAPEAAAAAAVPSVNVSSKTWLYVAGAGMLALAFMRPKRARR